MILSTIPFFFSGSIAKSLLSWSLLKRHQMLMHSVFEKVLILKNHQAIVVYAKWEKRTE